MHPSLNALSGKRASRPERPKLGFGGPPEVYDAGRRQQHRAEYQRPAIWLWRRLVGIAFSYLLVMLAWLLVKMPDGLVSDEALPTPVQVSSAFYRLLSDGFADATLFGHASASLYRLVVGLVVGLAVGAVGGLALGSAPLARTIADPPVAWIGFVPAVALAPLVLRWFGSTELSVVLGVVVATGASTTGRVAALRAASVRGQRLDVTPLLIDTVRVAVLVGWSAVLAVETVVAPLGLGPLIWSAQNDVDVMIVGIVVTGAVGFVIDGGLRLAAYLTRWSKGHD